MTDRAILAAKDQVATCIHDLFMGTDQRDWVDGNLHLETSS
ncbi:MAG: hypothetical protein ABR543_07905 [Gemmatimonadaceae bacterium]